MILWKLFKEKRIYAPFNNTDCFCFQIQNVKWWAVDNIGKDEEFIILREFFKFLQEFFIGPANIEIRYKRSIALKSLD